MPMIALAAAATSSTVGATAPKRHPRFRDHALAVERQMLTPALTTAMSISVRGMKRR